jgi:hypothetical protein
MGFNDYMMVLHSVVSTSFRDSFSAKGRVTVVTKRGSFTNIPRIFGRVHEYVTEIRLRIKTTPIDVLKDMWQVSEIKNNRIAQWIALAAKDHYPKKGDTYDAHAVLEAIFD